MKKNRFFALTAFCAGLFLASCSQDEALLQTGNDDTVKPKTDGVEFAIADVKTAGPTTRAAITPVTAWATAADKNIGVTVYKTKAATELMFNETINQKWTYTAGTWSTINPPVMYNGDGGFVTAYYPWSDATDPKAVSIDNTKDWMYSKISDSQQVDYWNHTVSLTMSHATTQIKVNIYRKGYSGPGNLTSISVKADKFASAAKLNSLTGELSNHTLIAKLSDESLDETLGAMGGGGISAATLALHESFVPVDDEACTVQFDAIVDGIKLRVKVDDQLFEKGKVYTYKLNVTNVLEETMEISEVEIKPWDEVEGADEDLVEHIPAERKPVDLGLPSGLKWAAGNIGTDEIGEIGLYFAWGETTGYANASEHAFSQENYNAGPAAEIATDLDLEHDAARANLGGSWRMPTRTEFQELADNCFMEWTNNYDGTGTKGVIYYSTAVNATGKGYYHGASAWYAKSGNNYSSATEAPAEFEAYTLDTPHIFIPAAGYCGGTSLSNFGSDGVVWSSSRGNATSGYNLIFDGSGVGPRSNLYRWNGFTVRGVCE